MPGLTLDERTRLLKSAQEARSLSYSPYSHFRVGAALLLNDGQIVQGANVENASYGAGICAERTALLKAQTLLQPAASSDESRLTGFIRAIAVTSDLPSDPCSPCGICRQFIREFATLDTPILMVWDEWDAKASHGDESAQRGANTHDEKGVVVRTLDELLPLSFGPDKLIK